MRHLLKAFVVSLALAFTTTAQTVDAELTKLRELLDVPASTEIVPSTSPLPSQSPIRVFVAVGPNPKIQKAFSQRFANWNKKEGPKYGLVELVLNLSEADVILVRYDERLNDRPPPSYSTPLVPTRSYSYLISRRPDRLEVLWRTVVEGYSDVTDTNRIGSAVRNEFFKRMKARAKP